MPGRHAATAGPRSLPLSLSDSSSLTRAGIAAALVTASAAAVAGSTGAIPSFGSDVAPAAATLTTDTLAYPPAAIPAPRAPVVTPVVASAPVAKAAPVTKEPARKAATPTRAKAKAKAVPTKAAAPAAAAGLGSLGTRIVSKAASFEGTPYVYGATGPSSFDCSGLTSYVFKKMGISIPRTAQQQYDAAQHLSRSQAQPGDLIFMGSPSNIYHVAIYAGNGKIWTAPEPGESVKLGNLWGNWHVGRIR
ncbi:C40 family peptidase [Actinomycetospora atypica]|uniref:C40 family peptidase n=1 Tax=Actinomycetospora atypica TaxID=1290095 RepID=A0ABV9YQE2_9PSEU